MKSEENMKKIAIFDYDMSNIGGVEKVSCQIANELVNYFEVYLISTTHRYGKIPYQLDERIHYFDILENENHKLRKMVIKTRKKLRQILKEEKIDILFSMGTYNGLIAAINGIGLKTKIVFCDHGALVNQLHEKSTTIVRWIVSFLSYKTVVLTEQSCQDYKRIFKIPEKKIVTIYNWIDEEIFSYVQPYKYESNKIISVGRLTSEKGFDMLIEVAKKLKEWNQNWQWDIYGDRSRI